MYLHVCPFLFDLAAIPVSERSMNNKELFRFVGSRHLVKDRQTIQSQHPIWPQYGLPTCFAVEFFKIFCRKCVFATDISCYDSDEKQKTTVAD